MLGTLAATLTPSASHAQAAPAISLLHEPGVLTVSQSAALRTAVASGGGASATVPATHTVRSGDTISSIASRYGLRTADVLAWNGLGWSSVIYPGQVVKLKAGSSSASSSSSPSSSAPKTSTTTSSAKTHTVVRGDTVYAIAKKYGTTVSAVLKANGIGSKAVIFPGQKLTLPGTTTSSGSSSTAPSSSSSSSASSSSSSTPKTPTTTSSAKTHTVVRGDTVYAIAKKYGTTVSAVLKANGIGSNAIIYPGQKLTLPGTATSSGSGTSNSSSSGSTSSGSSSSGSNTSTPTTQATSHTVVSGDTIYDIAKKYSTTSSAILTANGIGSNAIIYPGQKLVIPGTVTTASTNGVVQKTAVLDAEQIDNVRFIIGKARELNIPDRGIAIALATAMVESWIRNLDYGDRDSLGLFQQRPSTGWGTADQVRDREHAVLAFFGGATNPNKGKTRGLLDISGWQDLDFSAAAQSVQKSAFPDRYGQWETQAFVWLELYG